MHLILERFAYTPSETQGRLFCGDFSAWTIERPWVAGEEPGGKPFASCVPDGDYELIPFTRSSGDQALALVNHSLGVNLFQEDGPGRYAILIHSGNWVTDVVGCIAPGKDRTIHGNQIMVTSSKASIKALAEVAPFDEQHTITIRNSTGTST